MDNPSTILIVDDDRDIRQLLADYLDLKDRFTPGVAAYYAGISAEPSFVRALAWEKEAALAQGISPTPAPLLVG